MKEHKKEHRKFVRLMVLSVVLSLLILSDPTFGFEILFGSDSSSYTLGNTVTFSVNGTIVSDEIVPVTNVFFNVTGSSNSLTNCELVFNSSGYTNDVVTCGSQTLTVNLTTQSNLTYGYGYTYANLTSGSTSPSDNPYYWGYGYGYGFGDGTDISSGTTYFNYTISWDIPSSWTADTYTAYMTFNTSNSKVYYETTQFTASSPATTASTGYSGGAGTSLEEVEETPEEPTEVSPVPSAPQEGCTESWSCSDWSDCIDGTRTRTCTDSNGCGTTGNKPPESEGCVLPAELEEEVPLGVPLEALPVASLIIAGLIVYIAVKKRRMKKGKKRRLKEVR